MSKIGTGSPIAYLNQIVDETITIKSDKGQFKTLEEAQKAAKEVSLSETEDAVVVKNENNTFQVFGIDEVGKLDPSGDSEGIYRIHEADANVMSFSISKRDSNGLRVKGGGETEVKLRNDGNYQKWAEDTVKYVAEDINLSESNKLNAGFLGATFGGIWRARSETGAGMENNVQAVMKIASEAERTGFGNCREQACLAARDLMMKDVPNVEVFGKHNHAFVVIGRDPDSNPLDPSTWGSKAMVVDPWQKKSYPATSQNIYENMGICKEKWTAGRPPDLWQEARITDDKGKVVQNK